MERIPGVVSRMNLHVLLQVRPRSKRFCALRTLKGLLSCVYPLVSYQIGDLAKGYVAAGVPTHEGLHFVMDSSVFLKTRILGKLLVTLRTT